MRPPESVQLFRTRHHWMGSHSSSVGIVNDPLFTPGNVVCPWV
jgi:hypothetical protein